MVGEVAAEVAHDAAADAEAEAGAGLAGGEGVIDAVEAGEDAFAVVGGDAGAEVGDVEGRGGMVMEVEGDFASVAGVFDGVVEEVEEDLFEGVGVGVEGEIGVGEVEGEVESGFGEARLVGFGDGTDEAVEGEVFVAVGFAALFEAAEVEDVVDEAGKALAFADDDVEVGGAALGVGEAAFFEHFGVHADGGEGGF